MKQPEKFTVLEVLMSLPESEKSRFVDSLEKGQLRTEKGSMKRASEAETASSPSPQSHTDVEPLYDEESLKGWKEISAERWEALLRDY